MVPLIAGLAVFFFVIIGGLMALVLGTGGSGSSTTSGGGGTGFFAFGDRIAILEIEGVLGEGPGFQANTKVLVRHVNEWTRNNNIKGILVRVNSPGGAVSATQDLYHALQAFRETNRPVVVSMGDVAASGGYYAAMAADQVFANEGSLTGSIGVILSFLNWEGFQQKIGVYSHNVKSGEFKDMGSGSRPMTDQERELLQTMIADVHAQFVDAVVESRGERVRNLLAANLQIQPAQVTDAQIRAHIETYTDGQIFTGRQAYNWQMIDSIGTFQVAFEDLCKRAGVPTTVSVVRAPVRPTGLFGGMSGLADRIQTMPSDPFAQVRLEYRLSW